MAKLPTNEPDNGWDSPEPAELADRMNARLGLTDEGAEPEPEPAPDDTPATGTDDEPEPTAKAKDGGADRTGGKADPDEDDRVFEIDGEKFTADEIREMKLGALRQADYTRKTQQLAEQRRNGDEALTQMVEQNRQMMQYLLRQAGAEIDPNTGLPVNTEEPGEPLDPRVARTLEEQNQRLNSLLEARETEHQAAQQGALDDFIITNFDRSLTTLFDKYGVKDQRERALYRNAIVGADPQTVDPATGEVTTRSVYEATRREFLKLHQSAEGASRQRVDKTLAGMKPHKPAVTPGAAPQKPRQDVGLLRAQRRGMPDWDSEGAINSFLKRAADLGQREE